MSAAWAPFSQDARRAVGLNAATTRGPAGSCGTLIALRWETRGAIRTALDPQHHERAHGKETSGKRDMVKTPGSPSALLESTSHRPWPLPSAPWVMYQRWSDLLFMHWLVPRRDLTRLLPSNLRLDTFEDQAWIGVTPFRVSALRARGFPRLPGLSSFPEVNVRTYVRHGGVPGVFFFSLDAGNRLAVEGARRAYALPYFSARMDVGQQDGGIRYRSRRQDGRAPSAELHVDYEPVGLPAVAEPGSLAHWLTERYCLYAQDGAELYRADIHHRPWPLQAASVAIHANTLVASHGVRLPATSPRVHFSRDLDVLVWWPRRVA